MSTLVVESELPSVVQLVVAYDGAGFHGMAADPGARTVAGELQRVLSLLFRQPIMLSVAGRTDAGVHAWGQAVTFALPAAFPRVVSDPGWLRHRVNRLLGPEVVVRSVSIHPPGFDARYSARARRYRYTVSNRPIPDPFLHATSWWVPESLNLAALRLGCDPLVGEHDFSSFCRKIKDADPERPPSMRRRVTEARWEDEGNGILCFWIEANAFCHQMVRSVVGTLVDVGRGHLRAGDMAGILRAGDRSAAGRVAPAQGLCLWQVVYSDRDPHESASRRGLSGAQIAKNHMAELPPDGDRP